MSGFSNITVMIKSKRSIILLLLTVLFIFSGLLVYIIFPKNNAAKRTWKNNYRLSSNPRKAIFKVGSETIYQQDLDYEINNYPPDKEIDLAQMLSQKLINDSILIQEGIAKGYIKNEEGIYNSLDKNYPRRIFLVEKVKNKIRAGSSGIMGTVVTIWFYNNDEETSIGYDAAKKLALAKITSLHKAVKNKSMTIHQAAQAIKNDKNLVNADPQYELNAFFDFRVNKGAMITHDPLLDKALWSLDENEVSDIFTGHSRPNNSGKEANYHFGTVQQIIARGNNNLDNWLDSVRKKYEITYY